jgi:hypothetical protein
MKAVDDKIKLRVFHISKHRRIMPRMVTKIV